MELTESKLTVSAEAFARLKACSSDTVLDLGNDGRIVLYGQGTVIIQASDQEQLVRMANVVKAIGLGFSLFTSLKLLEKNHYLEYVPLKPELPPRDRRKNRRSPFSRLLAGEGLNLRIIRNMTGIECRIEGGNAWVLGPDESVTEAVRQIQLIIRGRTRGTIQQYHRGKHGIQVRRKTARTGAGR